MGILFLAGLRAMVEGGWGWVWAWKRGVRGAWWEVRRW